MGIKISDLPTVITPALSDVFPIVQGGVTYKESVTQLSSILATHAQVQGSAFNFALAAGAADAYTVALTPVPTSYTDGLLVTMTANHDNTTSSPTLNVNGLGAKTITLWGNNSLLPSDIMTDSSYIFIYNADDDIFELINPTVSSANTSLVQSNTHNISADSGVANAYVAALIPAPVVALQTGMLVYLEVANTNTGASTLALNGEPPTPIVTTNLSPLTGGEMVAGSIAMLFYGTSGDFILLNSALDNPNPKNGVANVVVDSQGNGQYTTIQAGINAAAALLPTTTTPQNVYIFPGTYTEDITFASDVNLVGIAGCAQGGGVQIVGNATQSGGNSTVSNITFVSNNVNPAVSLTSIGVCAIQFYNCQIDATTGTGIYLDSSGTDVYLYDTTVNSSAGGQCWDVRAGRVVWVNPFSNNVDTASNIEGGVFIMIGGLTNDSYDLSAGTPLFSSYGTRYLSNILPVISVSATASVALYGGSIYTVDVGTTAVSGTGALNYNGVGMGPGLNFSNTLTQTGDVLNVGNLSFDGNNSTNNIDGGLWIGSGSGSPGVATLTAGTGISITNAANSITIHGMAATDGTFTPTITFGGTSTGITYSSQNGYYTQTGNVITFSIYILLSSKGVDTGAAVIQGFPVASKATGSAPNVFPILMSGATLPQSVVGVITSSATSALIQFQDTTLPLTLDDTYFDNATEIFCSGSYLV